MALEPEIPTQPPDATVWLREFAQRAGAGAVFRRSRRQRDLLEYLCWQALTEPPAESREQDIGVAVFGRERNYDTSQDNIVRVGVSELRKKLEEYFRTEGAAEPFVLTIPRGSYTPVVAPRAPAESQEPMAGPPESVSALVPPGRKPAEISRLRPAMVTLGALALLGAVAAVWLWTRNRSLELELAQSRKPVSELWQQFFRGTAETDVIVADSCLSLLTDIAGTPVSLPDYIARQYLLRDIATQKDARRRRELELLMSRRYTSMADVLAVQQIASLAAVTDRRISIYFARDFPSQRLGSLNLILVGSKRSNPWVEAFEEKLTFRIEFDPETHGNLVRNLKPAAGEAEVFRSARNVADVRESLAVIAYLRSPGKPGEVVLLGGTGLSGTAAAAEAFASPEHMARVLAGLGLKAGEPIPYFEALLRTHSVGPAVQSFEVVAVRRIF
jgi:hypothetical protein